MTGLEPEKCVILEIGVSVTDSDLNLIAEGPVFAIHQKDIVLNAKFEPRPGGTLSRVADMRERYLADVTSKVKLSRPIRVVAACGNGTAGAFAPEALRRVGAEVIDARGVDEAPPGAVQPPSMDRKPRPVVDLTARCACGAVRHSPDSPS